MRILLTDQDDYIYDYCNNCFQSRLVKIPFKVIHISEINSKNHTNALNFHLEYINAKERIINLDNFYQKLCKTNILSTFYNMLNIWLELYKHYKKIDKKEHFIYYFRIVISREKYKYVLSDRYPIFSISTIKNFNLNVSSVYMGYLCYKNKIDILEYLQRNNKLESVKGYIQNDDTLVDVMSNRKQIKVLEFLKNIGLPLKYSDESLDEASQKGQVAVLEWWKNSQLPLQYSYKALEAASGNGHINVLEWWKQSGLELKYDERVLRNASKKGHVAVLEWWKNSGLPLKYSERALNWASFNGHVAVLEWWKNSGLLLKYDKNVLNWASEQGRVAVLEWWKNSGLELKYNATDIFMTAITMNRIDVLEWWKNSGLPIEYNESLILSYVRFSKYSNKTLSKWWKNSGLLFKKTSPPIRWLLIKLLL
uniref:Ankyrin repeat protein n=1 Tax=viral metagenome TaxID=1070528 RepID=A0A6C0E688_9ZZZZ